MMGDEAWQSHGDGAGRMKGQARVEPAYVTFPGYGNRNVIDTVRSANTCGYNADGQLIRGCGVTRVSYSGANVVREHDGDWWYVLGPGLDDPVLVVKRGFVGAPGVTEAWYPVISDGHGDLLALADSAGQLQGTVLTPEYDAGVWNNSGLTGNAHSFNPRRQATPGGIDTISTFRTREYDPQTGKWLQEDPAGIAGGVNLYEYNGNDPNSFADPFGLIPNCPRCPGDVIHPATGEIRSVPMSEDPIFAMALGVAGAVTSAMAEAGTAVVEEAETVFGSPTLDKIAAEGEDVTGRGSVANRKYDITTRELQEALRGEGFTQTSRSRGAVSFERDATRVTTYPASKSEPRGPSAHVLVNGEKKMKIRMNPEP